MQALILAGGRGTRLRPYTTVIPKPLMPVGDLPILEIILRQLRSAGILEVILAVGYMGQMFQAFFADGARLGLKISYSFEDHALGTAGPIALALDRLQQNFLVMNGDLLTTLDYGRLFAAHCRSGAAATISMYRREVQMDFGVIKADADGRLADYIEKPLYQLDVSMGVNALNLSAVRNYLTAGVHLDIPDLMMQMKNDGLGVNCFKEPCYWLDIGRIDDYETANEIFESRKAEFLPEPGSHPGPS